MEAVVVQRMVRLTEEQAEELERRARLGDRSVEDLLCDAVETLLRTPITWARPTEEQRRRAKAAAGRLTAKETDLGVNHDHYLAEVYSE